MRIRESVKVGFNNLKIHPKALNSLLIIDIFTFIVFLFVSDSIGIEIQIKLNQTRRYSF